MSSDTVPMRQHRLTQTLELMRRYSSCKAFCIGFAATFFAVFDVPVFWPILLLYWFVLFFLTMKRQIRHMIKYRYVPFSVGEPVSLGCLPHAQLCSLLDRASSKRALHDILPDVGSLVTCVFLTLGLCFAGKKTYAGSQGSLGSKSVGKDQNGTK